MIEFSVLSTDRNVTETEGEQDFSKCGVNYCPAPPAIKTDLPANEEVNEDNFSITKQQRYILAGVYLICSVLSAVIVALFVDPLSRCVLCRFINQNFFMLFKSFISIYTLNIKKKF